VNTLEERYGVCPCADRNTLAHTPSAQCFYCHGSGYRLVKRIVRAPAPTHPQGPPIEHIAEKAARTLEVAAQRFLKLGHPHDAQQTRDAAQALRASVEGQG
jgi:hypothetical protein